MESIKLVVFYKMCRKADVSFLLAVLYWLYAKIRGKDILMYPNTIIKGFTNIKSNGRLYVGFDNVGFTHAKDRAFLNVQGRLQIQGSIVIGKGCRFDIAENALVDIGRNTVIRPFTNIIIQHGLKIGNECSISWYCQFMDEDFHEIQYEGKKETNDKRIIIGDKVWIGNHVSVYKGSIIGNHSVIASNSVVKGKFEEEDVLIAGNPAKIIKRNIVWQ